jgi:hypothetical protein
MFSSFGSMRARRLAGPLRRSDVVDRGELFHNELRRGSVDAGVDLLESAARR